jgi:hypothetical protein
MDTVVSLIGLVLGLVFIFAITVVLFYGLAVLTGIFIHIVLQYV